MTDAQIQALIDAAKTGDSDKVTWAELKTILEGLKAQTSLTDLTPYLNAIPKWNGTAWVAADDQTATPGTPGNLDAVLTAGNETDEGIYFNETLSEPAESQAVYKKWLEFDSLVKTTGETTYQRVPFNWWQTATKQNSKVNEVMSFGWNMGNGGGAHIASRPGIGISMESNFSEGGERLVEMHDFYITPAGQQIRLESYTIRTASAIIDYYKTVSKFYIKRPDNGAVYFNVQPANTGAQLSISSGRANKSFVIETNEDSGGAGIYANGFAEPYMTLYGFTQLNMANFKFLGSLDNTFLSLRVTCTDGYLDIINDKSFTIGDTNKRVNKNHAANYYINTKSTDPTNTDIASGYFSVYKNTTSGAINLWANDGGTLKSVALS